MSEALSAVLSTLTSAALLWMILGTALGIIVGAMPGVTGAMLIALSLPLTFSMSSEHALVLLVSMYVGSVSGGLITATLLRIPGTPASMMTTLDGYPLAQAGEAKRALGLGIFASLVGGVISWAFLITLCGPLARLSLSFGPFEFFALVMLALVLIATVSGASLSKGLFAGALGMLLAMPGTNPATGLPRWTLGLTELSDGLKLLPVLIGLFAINRVITQLADPMQAEAEAKIDRGSLMVSLSDVGLHWVNLFRSSVLGTFVGILPGVGANIGSVVAYSAARAASKSPERFGKGSEEGIVASEAANNATVGGALIPLIAMGIPGSVIDAILLGAFTIHGLQPGPLLMEQNPGVTGVIMGTLLLANVFMFLFMLVMAPWLARLSHVPNALLLPTIITLSVIGAYALANRMFDVWVMLIAGLLGFGLDRLKIPLAPLVIGFVLAPLAEQHLAEGLMQSAGHWAPLFTRPIALLFLMAALFALGITVLRHVRREKPRNTSQVH